MIFFLIFPFFSKKKTQIHLICIWAAREISNLDRAGVMEMRSWSSRALQYMVFFCLEFTLFYWMQCDCSQALRSLWTFCDQCFHLIKKASYIPGNVRPKHHMKKEWSFQKHYALLLRPWFWEWDLDDLTNQWQWTGFLILKKTWNDGSIAFLFKLLWIWSPKPLWNRFNVTLLANKTRLNFLLLYPPDGQLAACQTTRDTNYHQHKSQYSSQFWFLENLALRNVRLNVVSRWCFSVEESHVLDQTNTT